MMGGESNAPIGNYSTTEKGYKRVAHPKRNISNSVQEEGDLKVKPER